MPRKYFFNIEKIKIESYEKYYWLGFIAGDGSVQEQGRRLRIELKNDSLDILEILWKAMQILLQELTIIIVNVLAWILIQKNLEII